MNAKHTVNHAIHISRRWARWRSNICRENSRKTAPGSQVTGNALGRPSAIPAIPQPGAARPGGAPGGGCGYFQQLSPRRRQVAASCTAARRPRGFQGLTPGEPASLPGVQSLSRHPTCRFSRHSRTGRIQTERSFTHEGRDARPAKRRRSRWARRLPGQPASSRRRATQFLLFIPPPVARGRALIRRRHFQEFLQTPSGSRGCRGSEYRAPRGKGGGVLSRRCAPAGTRSPPARSPSPGAQPLPFRGPAFPAERAL